MEKLRNYNNPELSPPRNFSKLEDLRNRHYSRPSPEPATDTSKVSTEDLLYIGILDGLELKVRQNLAKHELDEITVQQIVDEIVTHRHDKIKAINSVVRILSQTADGKELDNAFYREIYQTIDDIQKRASNTAYLHYIFNHINAAQIGQGENSQDMTEALKLLYLYFNHANNSKLVKLESNVEKLDYFVENYNKFISVASVDEWRDERYEKKINSDEDENSVSSVEGARFSTVIKLAESIALKITAGIRLDEIKDLLRTTIYIDTLVADPDNLNQMDRAKIGQHFQYALTSIINKLGMTDYPNMEHNIYASGYPDIKLFVEYISSKLMEVQIYTEQTVKNKKLEEAAGLYGARKIILSDLNQLLEKYKITSIQKLSQDSDQIKRYMQNLLAYTIPIQAGDKIYLTISKNINEETQNRLIGIIKDLEIEIQAKVLDRDSIIKKIAAMSESYHNLLIDSRDYFKVGAIFENKDEIAQLVEHYNYELKQKLEINVYE
jgi:hypothetical protein